MNVQQLTIRIEGPRVTATGHNGAVIAQATGMSSAPGTAMEFVCKEIIALYGSIGNVGNERNG